MLAESERGGEAGGLDSEKIDEPGNAVIRGTLDQKIPRRLALGLDFRADSRVGRRKRPVLQRRPIAANCGIEHIRSAGVDIVIDRIYPFDVRSESCLSGQIERGVNAQTR